MLKKLYLPILLSALLGTAASCNSSSSDTYEYTESASVLVSGFSLSNDSEVLDSLENVFFSIDLENGKIFNADSLPYGTVTTALIPKISAPSTASEVSLKFYSTKTQRDSVINYLTNSTDSVDFSYGPVTLTIKSQSGLATKDYEIKVNVHQMKADSLAWYKLESAPAPTTFSVIQAQSTARKGDTYYNLVSDGSHYQLNTTTDPSSGSWTIQTLAFAFEPKVESLRATADNLYILSTSDELYESADGQTWNATGKIWHYIYGDYENDIFGAELTDAGNYIERYPSGIRHQMPSGFPIEGVSLPASYTTPLGYTTQLVMVGGRRANGTVVDSAWGYDGETWAEMSISTLPTPLEYIMMVPYHLVETPVSTWASESYPALIAIGGRTAQGEINRTVYYSCDWGMTWKEAPELMQLPDEFPSIYGGSIYEYNVTMNVESRSDIWRPLTLSPLPRGSHYELPEAQSRATTAITEWDCPEIYIFGGRDSSGKTVDNIWRGVIYYFTFKPVQ